MNPFHYQNGLLYAEDVALHNVADAVGTPCYVYSQTALEQNWHNFDQAFAGREHTIFYSVKANSNIAVLALMARLGSGFDIVSGGELERVIQAGGDPAKTIFSGVGKSIDEIRFALESGVFSLNLESEAELVRIQQIAGEMDTVAAISIRVNPDIDPKTHPHVSTGLRETKFGVPFDEACRIYAQAARSEHLNVLGIAVHIGSQITSMGPFIEALERVIDLVERLADDGINIRHLDLGGGLGIRYRDEQPPSAAQYGKAVCEVLERRNCAVHISMEPGRSIAGDTGVLLSCVEYIKRFESKNFAIVDGAMNDLLRPVLYDAWMDIIEIDTTQAINKSVYDVVGPVCETGDFLGKDRTLGIESGDLIAVCNAGAYGAVMSSNYNTRPRPAEVLVSGADFEVIRNRESVQQMLDLETVPQRLRS